jgi:hypothetical protein
MLVLLIFILLQLILIYLLIKSFALLIQFPPFDSYHLIYLLGQLQRKLLPDNLEPFLIESDVGIAWLVELNLRLLILFVTNVAIELILLLKHYFDALIKVLYSEFKHL